MISLIANRAFYLTDEERTRFVERLWRVAKFSGIEVLAYCFMSNHFHLLVHLPEASEHSGIRAFEHSSIYSLRCSQAQMPKCCSRALNAAKRC